MISRREFMQAAVATATFSTLRTQTANLWGGSVLDLHLHYRRQSGSMLAHIEGSGVARAVVLDVPDTVRDQSLHYSPSEPIEPANRFLKFTSINVTRADAVDILRKGVQAGAIGFGEMISPVSADGPEMRKVYELAAELKAPVLIHFQEVIQGSADAFNTGFARLPALLKEYRNTLFIGHANSFWANISAEVPSNTSYPTGPIKRGGLTDQMLSEYPNLYGDLSATSGLNALVRDTEFAADFLARHQDRLLFGSDCNCRDGQGAGQNVRLPLIAGKCIARETLSALKELASPEAFRKITWENAVKLLKIP